MGLATTIQLAEIQECSYQPLADTIREILPQEAEHHQLGVDGLAQLLKQDFEPATAQGSVDYWYPRVADTFGDMQSERFELYKRFGLRSHSNRELKQAWQKQAADMLHKLSLHPPQADN